MMDVFDELGDFFIFHLFLLAIFSMIAKSMFLSSRTVEYGLRSLEGRQSQAEPVESTQKPEPVYTGTEPEDILMEAAHSEDDPML